MPASRPPTASSGCPSDMFTAPLNLCYLFCTCASASSLSPTPQYDKFHLRGCIDALLMELWRDPNCAASLTGVATAAPDSPAGRLFADFVGAVLNDLMYLLKDSLQVGEGGGGGGAGGGGEVMREREARVGLASL